ncbi:kinase-like protein [Neolentinus lepideus HHB14362 ss-1]|uniref:Kinase-like protein n=1 Tax=Neolentinus lepideus HHB14362 ss-1 TaxID=1314782 RepID=A0A165VVA1_9AGAM|nr:kinase-like protein [Neolentinus lepideus HHB14362 ss-1]
MTVVTDNTISRTSFQPQHEATYIVTDKDNLNLDRKASKIVRVSNYCTTIGEYSDVWKVYYNGKEVAVKVLRGGSLRNEVFMKNLQNDIYELCRSLKALHHPYVQEILGLTFDFGYMPGIVMPWYSKGNIIQFLSAESEKGGEEKLRLMCQVAEAVEYIHTRETPIVHGDIRGANILIDADNTPKLCDIGLTFITNSSEFTTAKTAGNCRWASPEVLNPESDEDLADDVPSPYTKESDIYALGMTIHEVFTGLIPFHSRRNDVSVIFAVIKGERPEIPDSMKEIPGLADLVERCWKADAKERPTAGEVHTCLASTLPVPNHESGPIQAPSTWEFMNNIVLAPIRWVMSKFVY